MARIAKKVSLTDRQEQILRSLSGGRTTPAHLQQRATILLYCFEGKTNLEIMNELGVHKKTISKWRNRWATAQEKLSAIENKEQGIAYQRSLEQVLRDTPRCGAPCKFTSEQICLIMNVACESPQDKGLALSHWSLSSLADELVKRKIVDSISTSQLQVFLKSGQYKTSQSEAVDTHAHRR